MERIAFEEDIRVKGSNVNSRKTVCEAEDE
jgi:hypothetical protein